MSELGRLDGVHVMDLYAGSGALGLEALSRGAASVLLVESDSRAAAVIKANVKVVGLPGATVAANRVERVLARKQGDPANGYGSVAVYCVIIAIAIAAVGWLVLWYSRIRVIKP